MGEKRANPRDHGVGYSRSPKEGAYDGGVNVI